MQYEPEGLKESIGAALGMDERHVKKDLERFKELIESRGLETGGWRGEVQGGTTTAGHAVSGHEPADRPTNPY
jgi:hypothetical protein